MARRRARTHNMARRFVETTFYETLAASGRGELDPGQVRERLHGDPAVVAALEWMWPVLTPAELLHDLFGSRALLRMAAGHDLGEDERELLYRKRSPSLAEVDFTHDDVPLLDEARALLGPKARRRADEEAMRTYGHIVVDEAQDLSPMQLRMLARRSLNGSMTVVGDIAQATGAWAHANWDDILDHLPAQAGPARRGADHRLPHPGGRAWRWRPGCSGWPRPSWPRPDRCARTAIPLASPGRRRTRPSR